MAFSILTGCTTTITNSRTLSSAPQNFLNHKRSLPIPPLSSPWQPLTYFPSIGKFHIIWRFWTFHISRVIHDLDSSVPGFFQYAMLSKFIHIMARISTSLYAWTTNYTIYHILFIHSQWWTFWLFPFFGCYECRCYEHLYTRFRAHTYLQFYLVHT